MNEENENKIGKVRDFFSNGVKKTFSSTANTSDAIRHIKQRSTDLYSGFSNIFSVFITSFAILFYYIIGFFRLTKNIPQALSRAAQNNFRLGMEALKINNLIDARIRFLLSNLFYGKSATTKYYIAYVYYRQQNITKSLKYLKQALFIDNQHSRSLELLKEIEKQLHNN